MWGYELIHWIEPTVPIHPQDDTAPADGIWMLMDGILIFDQVKRLITAVAYADLSGGCDVEDAWQSALARIADLRRRMDAPLPAVAPLQWSPNADVLPDVSSNRNRSDFEAAVESARAVSYTHLRAHET